MGSLLRGALRAHQFRSQIQCLRHPFTAAAVAGPRLCQPPPFADSGRIRRNSTAVASSADAAAPVPFPHPPGLYSPQDAKAESARRILLAAASATRPRNDWTRGEVSAMYYQPLLELAHQAVRTLHLLSSLLLHIISVLMVCPKGFTDMLARASSTGGSTSRARFSCAPS